MEAAHPSSPALASRPLWLAALLAAVAATVANALIRTVAVGLFGVSSELRPFTLPQLTLFTVVGVLGAALVYAQVLRRAERPVETFRKIALVVLLGSFVPDVGLLVTGVMPGFGPAALGALILMHVVTVVIAVRLLTDWTRGACSHLSGLLSR